MSEPMRPGDPAYWMLEHGLADTSERSQPTVYRRTCYICNDPEFSLMGLPLCFPCTKCGGHVPADDSRCDDCRHDCHDDERQDETELDTWSLFGQLWLQVGNQINFDRAVDLFRKGKNNFKIAMRHLADDKSIVRSMQHDAELPENEP